MAKHLPSEIDESFLLGVILIFLMINYNMPLATIYSFIVVISSLMYLVPIQFNFFRWIPFSKPGSKLGKIIVGTIFGFGFIWVYNQFSTTPMSAVFATTVFGESEILTVLVYTFLITWVESIFFFRNILQWWAWKTGDSVHISPFSGTGFKLMLMFGAVFTLFHATAKGVDNQIDLMFTLLFGMLSVGMVLYFQEMVQTVVMHIVVNGKAMGVFNTIQEIIAMSSSWIIIIGIIGFMYWLSNKKTFTVLS